MADLRVNFAGVPFKNPIVVASAEPTMSVSKMKQSIDTGAGGLVVKTLTDLETMRKLSGYAQWMALDEQQQKCQGKIPRTFSLYGRSGLSAEPPDVWIDEVKKIQPYAEENNCVIIGSVGASTPGSWARLAKMQEDAGIKLIEFNFGCPHPSQMENAKTGMLIGQDIDLAAECVHAAAKEVSVPIIAKLTPQVVDLVEMSRAVKQAGASGVTLTNRFVGFAVDIETGRPYLNSWAGVGGPWVKSLTLRWVSKVHLAMDLPITGSNGLFDWRDSVQFIMSGATIVQYCSVIMVKGYRVIPPVIKGLEEFMDRKGYKTVEEMRGIAARAAYTYDQLYDLPRPKAVVNEELCTNCEVCIRSCWYEGLVPGPNAVQVVQEKCIGCTLCTAVCPTPGAITI